MSLRFLPSSPLREQLELLRLLHVSQGTVSPSNVRNFPDLSIRQMLPPAAASPLKSPRAKRAAVLRPPTFLCSAPELLQEPLEPLHRCPLQIRLEPSERPELRSPTRPPRPAVL